MRILIVNTFYYPNMKGGAEQSVKLLAEGLAGRGHKVAVWCIDGTECLDGVERSSINGVSVYRGDGAGFDLYRFCYHKSETSRLWKYSQKIKCYFNRKLVERFREICLEFKPDVIHTNSMNGIPKQIWKEGEHLGIPVVHTIRDTAPLSPYAYGHHENSVIKSAYRLYFERESRHVSAVTAPSSYTLDTSLKPGNFSRAVIRRRVFNSVKVDVDKLKDTIRIKSLRANDPIRFMYAGRLLENKGIRHMLDAFSRLSEECSLHVCGDGELAGVVKESSRRDRRIVFHGQLSSERLSELYDFCDVLIVPSCWPEPFGRVVIEGNLHGLPVLACRVGGIPEILEVTKGGSLYQEGSVNELLALLKKYLDRRTIISHFDGIVDSIKVFDIEVQIGSFETVYERIVK